MIFVVRIVTIGFITGFIQLVITPAPVLCSHDCGEIHLMGATEHLGHDHNEVHEHEHAPGSDHDVGHPERDHAQGDTCVDVFITMDTLLLPNNWTGNNAIPLATASVTDIPSMGDSTTLSTPESEKRIPLPPLLQSGRLLI